ncbi:hypothetical protein FB451DRAFT_1053500 [Mycena latifolia]|nr:hypothetical protein FB451DRAFT_1053500 [Mycena latifolia]
MQFSNLSIAAVLALAASIAHGAPTDETLDVSRVVAVGEYTLTVYKSAPATASVAARAPAAPRSCTGAATVACSTSHAASPAICAQLISAVTTNSNDILGDSPRAVCLGQSSNQCCISWSQDIGPMLEGALLPAAQKVYNTCFANSPLLESGLARQVILNGGCVTQCLSNRPTGCTD